MKHIWMSILLTALLAGPSTGATIIVGGSNGTVASLDTSANTILGSYDAGPAWFDIAVNNTGDVYGTTGQALYSIDVANEAVGLRLGNHSFVNSLAFDDSDVLFGAGGGNLYTLDLATGSSNLVGAVGGNFNSSGDIAFDQKGKLFASSLSGCEGGSDCLFSIDTSTGVGSAIGPIGYNNVYGLARIGGTLFGLTEANQLLSIDTLSGSGTLLGSYSINGLTYGAAVPSNVSVVPVPASMLLLLAGIGTLCTLRLQPRSRKT